MSELLLKVVMAVLFPLTATTSYRSVDQDYSCRYDHECVVGMFCNKYEGICRDINQACMSNDQCPYGLICVDQVCIDPDPGRPDPKPDPDPDPDIPAGAIPTDISCRNDAECMIGMNCYGGICYILPVYES